MIIKTKKYKLKTRTYIKIGFFDTMRKKWWIPTLLILSAGGLFYFKYKWLGIFVSILALFYTVFRLFQFYATTIIEGNKLFFQPAFYQISSKQILMQLTTKQGLPIAWEQVKYVRKKKKAFILFMAAGHFLYLPHRIFNTPQEIKFFELLLKRKKIKG